MSSSSENTDQSEIVEEGNEEEEKDTETNEKKETNEWPDVNCCCYCGEECNPYSQACGPCMRNPQ